MSLSNAITSNQDYNLLKLTVIEKGFTDIKTDDRSDGIRVGIHKAFEMIEQLATVAKADREVDQRDPDLYLET